MSERLSRVLLAATTPTIVGGAEAWAATAVAGLRRAGIEVALLHESPLVEGRTPIAPDGPTFMASGATIPDEVIRFAPDLVLVNGLADPEIEANLLARWPAVLFAHSYYGTCVTGTKRFAEPQIQACTRTLGLGCLLHHYPRRCGGLNPRTMIADYQRQQARRALLPKYRRVLVASEHMRQEYERHGVAADRLVVLPPSPYSVVPSHQPPPPPERSGRLLFLGRITALKGPEHFVRAAKLAGDSLGRTLSVTLAGDGPALKRVTALASDLGVPLESPNWVEGAERARVLRDHELLVMPSLWPEPFGMAALEAGAFGVPAAAYATGGIPDWLTPGVNGELAPANPPTPQGLAEAIVRALGDRAHYERLSRGAWDVARRHGTEAHVAALIRVLGDALGGMRFLFVSDFTPERASGAAGTLFALGDALTQLGHTVETVWREPRVAQAGTALDRHVRLGRRQAASVVAALAVSRYDVVIVSQPFAVEVFERLARRYPGTLFLNRTHGWEARVYVQQRRLRWDSHRSLPGRLASLIGERLTLSACRRTARAAHGVIAASKADARFVRESYRLPAERVAVIPYGADVPLTTRVPHPGGPRLMFVGHWVPIKGSAVMEDVLPRLAADHPQLSLTIVTRDAWHPRIAMTLGPSFGSRLVLEPWYEPARLATLYAEHDILVAPSLFEGFGKAALEGMRAGLCVVGSPEGGLPDIAEDGVHALFSATGDREALARRLDAAIRDCGLVERVGVAAAARAAPFSWVRTAAETVAFCEARRAALGMT